jgi:hypothetical protein
MGFTFDELMLLKGMLASRANAEAKELPTLPRHKGPNNQVRAAKRLAVLRDLEARFELAAWDAAGKGGAK